MGSNTVSYSWGRRCQISGGFTDWKAANQRKKDAVAQLAPLTDALDDLEVRIAELVARTKDVALG